MSDFSLTHPAPTAPRRNGNSDHWAGEAITRWLDAQLVSHDLDAACAAGAEIGKRLLNGDLWLKRHGDDHPKAGAARRMHTRLVEAQRESVIRQRHLYVKTWLEACALHGALNQVDDAEAWLAKHAPGVPDNTPRAIWHALQPERSPPFQTYPPTVEAYYVEHGFQTQEQLTAWMHRETT